MALQCGERKVRHAVFVIVTLLAVFGSHSQMAPATGGNAKIFEPGTGNSYQLTSTIILNEPAEGKGKDVGYQIRGDVIVAVVWQNPNERNEKLLEIELKSPQLLIKSRKAPAPEGFDVHKSYLETLQNSPFLVYWKSGKIEDVYLDTKEEISITNIKKGIASLFQFQVVDTETKETDASGTCLVSYKTIEPYTFTKTKTDCVTSENVPFIRHPDVVLSTNVTSSRTSTYTLSRDLSVIQSVTTYETHELRVVIKRDAGSSVSAIQHLTLTDAKVKVKELKSQTFEEAIKEFQKTRRVTLGRQSLNAEMYTLNCQKEECPSLPKLVKENREVLSSEYLGTVKSATAFIKLLAAARTATKDELTKAFKGSKNKEILAQLCDLAGGIQTPEAHEVIMKFLNFDADEDLENSERYLWALSIGSHPNEYVIKDIFKISQRPHTSEKLTETLVLALSSMAHRFKKLPGNEKSILFDEIKDSIIGDLNSCKEEECKYKYLRALKNLRCPTTIPTLIQHAISGKKKSSVEAMKAIRSFDSSYWDATVIDAAQKIYFQAGKKYDSSSRTLSLDILLESNPRPEILRELILTLTEYDSAYEVKQYLLQRVRQISEKNFEFSRIVESTLKEFHSLFNNYNIKALRGLTTAFTRSFTSSDYRNGSLVTIQEVSGGLLKRGIVDIVVETPETSTSLFTLGLFAGGLSSFVSSDDKQETNKVEEEEEEPEEPATAGMELSILGTQIRPFVFFSGQGELMGHVWSGTASEKTPAYQAFIVTHDHLEYISLQNGLMTQLQLLGVVSFDLSGQVQMSLWNRNAHSLVEKNAGISLQGRIRVDTSFVRSQVEFNLATEVKLNLQSDLNFYNGVSLCMQLSQPDSLIKHNIHKIERIPGSKHRLRKSKYKQIKVPGRTYALNRKNNEMCSLIFNDK